MLGQGHAARHMRAGHIDPSRADGLQGVSPENHGRSFLDVSKLL
jgi:hypothetical protein